MSTNMFRVSSGLGRYQFTKSNKPSTPNSSMQMTPTSKNSSSNSSSLAVKTPRKSNVYVKSDQEIIKQNNNELTLLKDNYMKLRDQYQKEKESYVNRLMSLEKELKSEQKRVMSLQNQLENLTNNNETQDFYQTNGKSIAVIENIWELMKSYREVLQERLKEKNMNEEDVRQNFRSQNMNIMNNDE
ncbi:hypothetical protein M9Y10_040840 [Tritrichomonas musculus]|uniref:Uncharacterized protein n=1 Tax=Tritrichomonas musculus TaxID=1915356 RepID=A0ABR2K4J1_9EUKA